MSGYVKEGFHNNSYFSITGTCHKKTQIKLNWNLKSFRICVIKISDLHLFVIYIFVYQHVDSQ